MVTVEIPDEDLARFEEFLDMTLDKSRKFVKKMIREKGMMPSNPAIVDFQTNTIEVVERALDAVRRAGDV